MSMIDSTYHYPPELMALLIEAIPRLCRSKEDTLSMLKGAGTPDEIVRDIAAIVRSDPNQLRKFEIVRRVLTRLNERGESMLRVRRELLKRVVEFDDFSTCWPNEMLQARGLVAQIQRLIEVKDSFTRMKAERDTERQSRMAAQEAEAQAVRRRQRDCDSVRDQLSALFSLTDARQRGKELERVLNRLFSVHNIAVRQAFTLKGDAGEGIVEQVDGLIQLDGEFYFVEMKWWKEPVGLAAIAEHMMRVFLRAEARAIVVSASDFTSAAVHSCKEALSQKVVALCTLEELVLLLARRGDLSEFLRIKVQSSIVDKNPFMRITC